MPATSQVPFPAATKPTADELADWVELSALARNTAFKRGDLKSAISQAGVQTPDLLEQTCWQVLERRAAMQETWPLTLDGNRVRRRAPAPVNLNLYRFLTLLSMGLGDATARSLFELLVAHLLTALTGRVGMHVGAPASAGRDPSFRVRIDEYVQASGLTSTEVKATPLSDDKDLGLDAVSWLRFLDNRGADLHFVAQCATGDDWNDKLDDLSLEVWADHVYWAVPPVRLFAVPRWLELAEPKWVRVARRAGIVLDRPRLVELAQQLDLDSALTAQVNASARAMQAA